MSLDDQVFEDQVAQSLRDTGEELTPRDLTGLVNGGVADGRRRRRRRNAAVVGGSAALALVAVGGAMVPSLLGTSHSVAGPASQPAMSLSASAKAVNSAEQAKLMIATLKSLVPGGAKITDASGRWAMEGEGGDVAPMASLTYDDGHGASLIQVGLSRHPASSGEQQPGCGDPAYTPNDVCHLYTLDGGAKLLVDQGYEYPSHGYGTKDWHATLIKADGSQIDVDEWNAPAEKGAAVTRVTPPLSADQLKALATSPSWEPLLDAMPGEKTHVIVEPRRADATALLKTLNGLLPQGVSGRNPVNGVAGFAGEQLFDGRSGASAVNMVVEHFDPKQLGPVLAKMFSGSGVSTLADGVKLKVQQDTLQTGEVRWSVTLLRLDGREVMIQESNAAVLGGTADRTAPVLTMDQLKALAENPAWLKLV